MPTRRNRSQIGGQPLGVLVVVMGILAIHVSGCAPLNRTRLTHVKLPVIKLSTGVVEILSVSAGLESPALSPNGERLAVLVEIYRDPLLPYEVCSLDVSQRDESGRWEELRTIEHGLYKRYLGRMHLPVQPSFDETGDHVLLTQIRFYSGLSVPWLATLRSWVESIPWHGGERERIIEHADWNMKPTELMQHARVSPDGNWLAFYTREHERTQGIYLLNLRSGEHHRLSDTRDKHPTWSPDGKRIYFHTVEGGRRRRFDPFATVQELSTLGFFELRFEGDRVSGWNRCLFDEIAETYVYHKHPAEVPGTGLLFFHGRRKPDGKLKLMVRLAQPKSQVFVVRPEFMGTRLKASKHPCSSFQDSDLVFVAKPKGEKHYRLLLSLTGDALKKVERIVRDAQRQADDELASK